MHLRGQFTQTTEDTLTLGKMRGGRWILAGVALGLPCFIVVGQLLDEGRSTDALTWPYVLGCIAAAAAVIYVVLKWDVRKKAEAAPREHFAFEITDDWIEIRGATDTRRASWSEVTTTMISSRGLALSFRDGSAFFIPSRAFFSGFVRTELKEFLTRKLKRA